jgi:hypothetical protein
LVDIVLTTATMGNCGGKSSGPPPTMIRRTSQTLSRNAVVNTSNGEQPPINGDASDNNSQRQRPQLPNAPPQLPNAPQVSLVVSRTVGRLLLCESLAFIVALDVPYDKRSLFYFIP